MHFSPLILLLIVPLVGALVCAFLSDSWARCWALFVGVATFVIAVVVGIRFFHASPGHPLYDYFPSGATIGAIGTSFHLGINSISVWLVILTAFLTPLAIWASFGGIKVRQNEYYAWMLGLLVPMLGVFMARDLLLFYVFFELTLVPMFFLIGIWGGAERRWAAGKFFLFTFAGGVFTLAATVYLGMQAGTFDISSIIYYAQNNLSSTARWWVALGLIAGFAVKTPLFPVHTWLPLAHTEAPTAGSVILAGVLLKLGTYGLLALAVPIGFIDKSGPVFGDLIHWIGIICIIGVIYGALCSWVQPDIKKLVAYSSVSHLGFCVLGLFALNDIGMQGSVLYMINHGLSTGAMFLVIGMIYDRYHTRDMNQLSGLGRVMPVLAFFWIFFTMASIGLPGLNGFWSEFLTILGAFTSDKFGPVYGACAALGVILGAVYMLHLAARVIFGPLKVPEVEHGGSHTQADQGQAATADHAGHGPGHGPSVAKNDLGWREIGILAPIAIAIVILGVKPGLVIDSMRKPVEELRTPSAFVPPTSPLPMRAGMANSAMVADPALHDATAPPGRAE